MSKMRFEIEVDRIGIGVSLQTYNIAMIKLIQSLREIDSAISGQSGGMVNWYVVDLGKNGTLTLDIESHLKRIPKKPKKQFRDTAPAVTKSFITGFENIQQHGISPPYLSESGLERLLDMMQLMKKNGARGFIATSIDDQRSASVNEVAIKNLQELLPPRRQEQGSIEGMLETISVHGNKKLIIYESFSGKGVTCSLPNSEEYIEQAKEALGKKVVVSGMVHFNIKDEPVKVTIENLRILGFGKHLPTTKELTGSDPNFTGDLSTDEYIQEIRRGR
jgi:hypothetical protein